MSSQERALNDYSPELLHAIPRIDERRALGIPGPDLPFCGVDRWNAYELSWLNGRGKPQVAVGRFTFEAASPGIVESKSMKLYLNSLNGERHAMERDVAQRIRDDLERVSGAPVIVELQLDAAAGRLRPLPGECIDGLDVEPLTYEVDPGILEGGRGAGDEVTETLHSHLLKSNCPVTGQPDWGSLLVRYHGRRIDHEALLKYIISYRDHAGFHEHCVERMFVDIQRVCRPRELTVHACYTRRGGLDINPFRSSHEQPTAAYRAWRQ